MAEEDAVRVVPTYNETQGQRREGYPDAYGPCPTCEVATGESCTDMRKALSRSLSTPHHSRLRATDPGRKAR